MMKNETTLKPKKTAKSTYTSITNLGPPKTSSGSRNSQVPAATALSPSFPSTSPLQSHSFNHLLSFLIQKVHINNFIYFFTNIAFPLTYFLLFLKNSAFFLLKNITSISTKTLIQDNLISVHYTKT